MSDSASYINRAACHRFLLAYATDTRQHKFSRVSGELLDRLNADMEARLRKIVQAQPSKGATIA